MCQIYAIQEKINVFIVGKVEDKIKTLYLKCSRYFDEKSCIGCEPHYLERWILSRSNSDFLEAWEEQDYEIKCEIDNRLKRLREKRKLMEINGEKEDEDDSDFEDYSSCAFYDLADIFGSVLDISTEKLIYSEEFKSLMLSFE
ncbi:unnamed protein product [Ambrosiozyma monospora]|uniref:Unnamed protein product n=1 Tax=Ambrosiozyma monospora TaxID=43982 RepID=A0ACB5UC43_AMBMO|nr:unnamed protein product [Ambrosiozyma monospora]